MHRFRSFNRSLVRSFARILPPSFRPTSPLPSRLAHSLARSSLRALCFCSLALALSHSLFLSLVSLHACSHTFSRSTLIPLPPATPHPRSGSTARPVLDVLYANERQVSTVDGLGCLAFAVHAFRAVGTCLGRTFLSLAQA